MKICTMFIGSEQNSSVLDSVGREVCVYVIQLPRLR